MSNYWLEGSLTESLIGSISVMVVKSNQKLDSKSYHIRGHIFSGSSQDSQVNETDNDSSRNMHSTFQRESFRDGVFTSVSALFLHVL